MYELLTSDPASGTSKEKSGCRDLFSYILRGFSYGRDLFSHNLDLSSCIAFMVLTIMDDYRSTEAACDSRVPLSGSSSGSYNGTSNNEARNAKEVDTITWVLLASFILAVAQNSLAWKLKNSSVREESLQNALESLQNALEWLQHLEEMAPPIIQFAALPLLSLSLDGADEADLCSDEIKKIGKKYVLSMLFYGLYARSLSEHSSILSRLENVPGLQKTCGCIKKGIAVGEYRRAAHIIMHLAFLLLYGQSEFYLKEEITNPDSISLSIVEEKFLTIYPVFKWVSLSVLLGVVVLLAFLLPAIDSVKCLQSEWFQNIAKAIKGKRPISAKETKGAYDVMSVCLHMVTLWALINSLFNSAFEGYCLNSGISFIPEEKFIQYRGASWSISAVVTLAHQLYMRQQDDISKKGPTSGSLYQELSGFNVVL